jgi:outer membrane protein TolC
MLRLAHDTRRAYFQAVAAEESARYMAQVRESAEAGAELAARMANAGNFPKLTRMREQAYYAEVTVNLARTRQVAIAQREKLTRLMGLAGDALRYQLPERLPDIPSSLPDRSGIEEIALRDRLDVQAAKRETERIASSLGLTKATRFINVLEVGRARKKDGDQPFHYGYEISLELPLFDWGGARVAKAEALYMQSVENVAEVAVNARSEAREAYAAYRTAYDTAKHYRDEIVPLRKLISEETLLRYNGMLIGVFELLVDAREQVAGVNEYIQALRDFWIASGDLQTALTIGSPGAMASIRSSNVRSGSGRGH